MNMYVWNQNHAGSGLILFAAVCADSLDEARGKLLGNKDLSPEMVELIRFGWASHSKASGTAHTATWDLREKKNPELLHGFCNCRINSAKYNYNVEAD